jgi:hypothetical protein
MALTTVALEFELHARDGALAASISHTLLFTLSWMIDHRDPIRLHGRLPE